MFRRPDNALKPFTVSNSRGYCRQAMRSHGWSVLRTQIYAQLSGLHSWNKESAKYMFLLPWCSCGCKDLISMSSTLGFSAGSVHRMWQVLVRPTSPGSPSPPQEAQHTPSEENMISCERSAHVMARRQCFGSSGCCSTHAMIWHN